MTVAGRVKPAMPYRMHLHFSMLVLDERIKKFCTGTLLRNGLVLRHGVVPCPAERRCKRREIIHRNGAWARDLRTSVVRHRLMYRSRGCHMALLVDHFPSISSSRRLDIRTIRTSMKFAWISQEYFPAGNMGTMTWLHETIKAQRAVLMGRLAAPMAALAQRCAASWRERDRLDEILAEALAHMPVCQLIYAIDPNGIQVSSNVGRQAIESGKYGQNLAHRPYLSKKASCGGFSLSDVYLSPPERRSCITAVQTVAKGGSILGFVAADFYLRDLPQLERRAASGQSAWRQIKGDPVIRDALFQQQRARSAMDERVDNVIAILNELVCERGVFHAKLHFSSSRATLWLTDDPYRYRVHVLEEIINPSICLAYPSRRYPEQTLVPSGLVRPVFERFKMLREVDENIYLRSGSLNVI
ncbi:MAG TPA: hypothetical protein VEI74_12670, partial [Candidatus Methylomirabilis sp.]|nr:hypothetical protein [Candidatus Methylomirabilis sp.]